MANPTWPNDEATYFLFVQQIHYERILKLDGDMRIFDINQIIPVILGVSLYLETYLEGKITYWLRMQKIEIEIEIENFLLSSILQENF